MEPKVEGLVVGYDGSDCAGAAVDWAAQEALRRRQPLTVLFAAGLSGVLPGSALPGIWLPVVDPEAVQSVADEGAQRAREAARGVDVRAVAEVGDAPHVMIAMSETADEIVVGSRGHGEVVSDLLGSVATVVSAHARCPVVVVRGSARPPGPGQRVVVGTDGSSHAERAVAAAADRAASSGAVLHVVTAYRVFDPALTDAAFFPHQYPGRSPADVAREAAEDVSTQARERVVARYPDLEVTTETAEGRTSTVLVEAAGTAALLVVGSRGRGGFASLLMGSASRAVVHHATCPVLVVHPERDHPVDRARGGEAPVPST